MFLPDLIDINKLNGESAARPTARPTARLTARPTARPVGIKSRQPNPLAYLLTHNYNIHVTMNASIYASYIH